MAVTVKRATRPARSRLRLVNAFTGWILRTPGLRRLADHQVIELRYTSASGRVVALPVMYAKHADTLVVLVGGPEGKRWWHHFLRPHPVEVLLRGATRSGVARVLVPGDRDRRRAEEVYAARFPDIPAGPDPLVVIDLNPIPQASAED